MKELVIGIVAHVDAGKTTCTEAMLYHGGIIDRLGRVDHQDAFFDYGENERKRGITIFDKQAHFVYRDTMIHLIDTPGHIDFESQMEQSLKALDVAILVISARDGVQSHTQTIIECLNQYQIPTIIFINKMDIAIDPIDQICQQIGEYMDHLVLMNDDQTIENIALSNDHLLEQYMSTNQIMHQDMLEAFLMRQFFPVYTGSALKDEGIIELMDGICQFAFKRQYPDEFGAIVYQISQQDQTILTHLKITGGILLPKQKINEEKIDEIRYYQGSQYTLLQQASAGTIVCVKGLTKCYIGQGLGFEEDQTAYILKSNLIYQVFYDERVDRLTLIKVLQQMQMEDPSLQLTIQNDQHLIQVHLQGELQQQTFIDTVYERSQIRITLGKGQIEYQETIADAVFGAGHFEPLRHYAEVQVKLEPLPLGSGIHIVNDIRQDALSPSFQTAILSAIHRVNMMGVLTGSPLTDVLIRLVAGKGHLKHTVGGDFYEAAMRAIGCALMKAKSLLLEPYVRFTAFIPQESLSSVLFILENHHSRFEIVDQQATMVKLVGRGPFVTMQYFESELIALTKGLGRYLQQMDGYDVCHNEQEVLEQYSYDPFNDSTRSIDSVFCKNGVGFIVPYTQLSDYIDLVEEQSHSVSTTSHQTYQISEEELKRIFERSTSNNRNLHKVARPKPKLKQEKPKPVDLRQKLLLIDGYNMIFGMDRYQDEKNTALEILRDDFIEWIANYASGLDYPVIIVFDGYQVANHPGSKIHHPPIEVIYTKTNQTADAYIEQFVQEHAKEYQCIVASNDGLIQNSIFAHGGLRISARALQQQVQAYLKQF